MIWAACAVSLLTLTACGGGGGHQLGEYAFTSRSIAAADYPTPGPELRTGSYRVPGGGDAIQVVADAGSRIAIEVEGRRARVRLDSASQLVDVRTRLAGRTLERSARYLGAEPSDDRATSDYLLEIFVRGFGVDARDERSVRVFMKTEAVLIERRTGHEIWSVDVDSHDRLTPRIDGSRSPVPAGAVTSGILASLSVDDMHRALAGLTDFTADYIADELRQDLRKLRRY
jgi:hypothetical protein